MYGNGVGTYNLNGGLLTGGSTGSTGGISGLEVIGFAGTGIFTQSGGTNHASMRPLCRRQPGLAASACRRGGYGAYTLSMGY